MSETKAKFTPGPWEAFITKDPTKSPPVGVLDGRRNIRVADVGQRGMSLDELNANARLIASAPELLSHLKLARTYVADAIAHREETAEPGDVVEHWRKDLIAIEAVIAKAEGTTND